MKRKGAVVEKPKEREVIQELSPESLIKHAIDKNVPVETMERLLAMRNQIKAELAREAFNRSMGEFQGKCPIITKTKSVKGRDGKERYSYAPLESIISQIGKLLSGCGLNYSFNTSPGENGNIDVACTIRHIDGHEETSKFSAPIDKDAYMNAPQKVASTHTYAKRYALCDVLGILTANEDDDANSVTVPSAPNKANDKIVITPKKDLMKKAPEKKAAEKKKSSSKTTNNFRFLSRMKEVKDQVGSEMYYEALKFCGFAKANLIVKRVDQIKAWKQLQKIVDSIDKAEETTDAKI